MRPNPPAPFPDAFAALTGKGETESFSPFPSDEGAAREGGRGVRCVVSSLLATPEAMRDYAAALSQDEAERAARFRFERDRSRYLVGRGILRVLLASLLDTTPESLRFDYSPHGKPRLIQPENQSRLDFNLAHSKDCAVFAFAWNRTLGVDIEAIKPDTPCDELAQNYFSESERAAYFALPEAERRAAFFRLWTRKEAYVKARGEGLTLSLRDFDVSLDAEGARLLATRPNADEANQWRVTNLPLGENFAGALVTSGPDYALELGAFSENVG